MSGKGLKKNKKQNLKAKPPKVEEANINILNEDCLIHIFEYLSLKDKLTLEFVNRRWNEVSKRSWGHVTFLEINNSFLNDYLRLRDLIDWYENERVNTAFLISVFRRCGRYLSWLCINGESLHHYAKWTKILKDSVNFLTNITELIMSDFKITSEDLKLLIENNKNLKLLYLTYITKNVIVNTSSLMSLNSHLIEGFVLQGCRIDDSAECFFNFLTRLSNIKIFNLEFTRQSTDYDLNLVIDALNIANIDQLTELSLVSYKPIVLKNISNLLARQKELYSLHLNEIPGNLIETILSLDELEEIESENLNPEFLNALYCFTNLNSLKGKVPELTDQILQSISKCQNLEKLDLSTHSFDLKSESEIYFSNFKNLETLTINNFGNERLKCCYSLLPISKCKNLTNLDIFGFDFEEEDESDIFPGIFPRLKFFHVEDSNISNNLLVNIIKYSPNLITCQIKDCDNISNEFINSVNDIKSFCSCINLNLGDLNYDCSCHEFLTILHNKTKINKNRLDSINRFVILEKLED